MNYKQIQRMKEIADIKNDYAKTNERLRNQKWDELQKHIQSILVKYPSETMIYNMAHTNPPKSLQENGQNCLDFLKSLLTGKIMEDSIDQ